MRDPKEDGAEEQEWPPGLAPEPCEPMDAPSLEQAHLKSTVRQASPPLASYVAGDEPVEPQETPFLRDTPFGDAPGFGGETPFFMGASAEVDFELDDTEGIPTGLPDLLQLPEIDWVPRVEDELPEVSGPIMVDVLGPEPAATDPAAAEAERRRIRYRQTVAFSAGVLLTSLLWGVLLYLSLEAQ